MLKKIGLLGLLICGGVLLHPAVASAQEYRYGNGYGQQYRWEGRYGRDGDGYRDRHREHEWREHEWREEQRERAWRAQEWREHERRENGWYAAPYGARGYYPYPY